MSYSDPKSAQISATYFLFCYLGNETSSGFPRLRINLKGRSLTFWPSLKTKNIQDRSLQWSTQPALSQSYYVLLSEDGRTYRHTYWVTHTKNSDPVIRTWLWVSRVDQYSHWVVLTLWKHCHWKMHYLKVLIVY